MGGDLTVFRNILVFTVLAYAEPSTAQDVKTDSSIFAQCSKQTNQLVNLNAGLASLHKEADGYNVRHDFLRGQLDRWEAQVQYVEQDLKEKSVKSPRWDDYDLAFEMYENALGAMERWNEYGAELGQKYQAAIDVVVSLQDQIKADCSGTWEPAIINKFCDDQTGRHASFCKEFEQ